MIILRKNFSLAGTRMLAGAHRLFGKNKIQAARKALGTEKKVIDKLAQAKTAAEKVVMNPGEAADKLIEAGIKNPVATGSQIAGKALMVAPVPVAVKAAPVGAGGAGLEALLKKNNKYRQVTENLADKYHKQEGLRRKITGGVNGIANYFQLAGA